MLQGRLPVGGEPVCSSRTGPYSLLLAADPRVTVACLTVDGLGGVHSCVRPDGRLELRLGDARFLMYLGKAHAPSPGHGGTREGSPWVRSARRSGRSWTRSLVGCEGCTQSPAQGLGCSIWESCPREALGRLLGLGTDGRREPQAALVAWGEKQPDPGSETLETWGCSRQPGLATFSGLEAETLTTGSQNEGAHCPGYRCRKRPEPRPPSWLIHAPSSLHLLRTPPVTSAGVPLTVSPSSPTPALLSHPARQEEGDRGSSSLA
ncbi:hypothetical protein CB1_000114016 [Camelus ferus]|nr:hypothetical protein CB1_000114016 [Camelus ferus]